MKERQFNTLVREVAALIRDLKRDPNYRPYINRAPRVSVSDETGMTLTIGVDPDGSWSWQSGDNSYTGGAYGFACWGVGTITGRCNARKVAEAMVNEAVDQMEYAE